MDIIQEGKDDIKQMSSLGCCWPPGTQTVQWPEPEDEF